METTNPTWRNATQYGSATIIIITYVGVVYNLEEWFHLAKYYFWENDIISIMINFHLKFF